MVNGTKIKAPASECTANYYDCIDGVAIEASCEKNYVFSKDRQLCVPKAQMKCPTFSPCAGKNTGFAPDPYSCDGYYTCSKGGKGTHDFCTSDMSFYENSCWPKSARCDIDICLIAPSYTYFGVDDDCSVWKICKGDKLEEGSCEPGLLFDRDDGSCTHELSANCRAIPNIENYKVGDYCEFDGFKIDYKSCTGYLYCHNNQVLRDDCAQGKFFTGTNCVSRLNYNCDRGNNPCEGLKRSSFSEWSWVNDPKDCKKFYHCVADKINGDSKSCPESSSYFNAERQTCSAYQPTYEACYIAGH